MERRGGGALWICNENPQHTIVERVAGSRTLSDHYCLWLKERDKYN